MFMKFEIKNWKRYIPVFIVTTISAYALYLRFVRLAYHSFNVDELFQIECANRPFFAFLKILQTHEFCSFLSGDYYLIYPFVKIFSFNKWGLAIPHVIATILGFYFLYLICKLYFKTIWGYIITFVIVCFNATLIEHATEIRTYAVLPTLALAVFYFSQLLVEQPNMDNKKKWLIGVFFVTVIWFQVYGVLILLLPMAFSLLSKLHDKSFKAILKTNIKLLILVLCIAMPLWLYSVFGPHFNYRTDSLPFEWISNPIVNPVSFLKSIFGNLLGYKKLYPLLIGIIFPFILPFKDRYKQIGFLFITVFIPIQLILLSDLKTRYWFLQRQFIWVMPFFAFFIGWAWESFFVYVYDKISRRQH